MGIWVVGTLNIYIYIYRVLISQLNFQKTEVVDAIILLLAMAFDFCMETLLFQS